MSEHKARPSGWIYAVATMIPVLGCLIAMAIVYQWFPGLPGTLESKVNLDNLTQLIVPGSKDITFAKNGAYAVYYEYRSSVDGIDYASSETPPALACTLTSKATSTNVRVVPDYVKTNSYSSKNRKRVGVLLGSITIDEPGTYTFSCLYADGSSQPEAVLAVGPNFVWEFFGIASRTVVTAAAGLTVLLGLGAIAAVVVIVIAVKRRNNSLKLVVCLALITMLIAGCGPVRPGCGQDVATSRSCSDSDFRHCTVITVSQGDRVFFGGNDDYINRDSTYWVDPGDATGYGAPGYGAPGYGAIYFGTPDNVQQGFNEKGLAYDANGLPQAPVTSHPGRKPVYGGYTSYPIKILQECATVEEVIAWVQEHRWHAMMHDQLHFADATGDAVVISAGPDGEVAFTRKPAGDGFLVSTNFNVANTSNGSYPCWRYSRAEEMLRHIQNENLTAERTASVLDAVHVETPNGWTLYSVVADLPQRLVYVYFWFQYDAPIVLNVDKEIARAPAPRPLSALFPPETVSRAGQAYQRLMARAAPCNATARAWLGVVGACLIVLLFFSWRGHRTSPRGLVLWMPVVAVLGPAGLLVWLIAGRGRRRGAEAANKEPTAGTTPRMWQRILVEAAGDMPPYVAGMVVALLAVFLVPGLGQGSLLQLLVFYGLPLAVGLFLYQAPLLAWTTRSSYVRTVLRRLPVALISTNLACAGLLGINLPLFSWYLNSCPISALTIPSLWGLAILGALMGGLLLYAYHAWAVRRGFTAWSALLWGTATAGDGPPGTFAPSWRRLWFWILVSFFVSVAGIALGVIGTGLAASVR